MEGIVKGTVKFYNEAKGFGFITGDDAVDVFVHRTGLSEGVVLKDGDKVSYKVVTGDRGLKAEQVTKESASEESASED